MNILFLTSEAAPYAKTGGLGDVMQSLPVALSAMGHSVRIALPEYRETKAYYKKNAIPVTRSIAVSAQLGGAFVAGQFNETRHPDDKSIVTYTLEHNECFDRPALYGEYGDYPDNARRYVFFTKAALELTRILDESGEWTPDVIHANDWQTALTPLYVTRALSSSKPFDRIGVVFTIHNLAYQGAFSPLDFPLLGVGREYFSANALEHNGNISFMKAGIMYADALTTVSPSYAKEIQTPEGGFGLHEELSANAKKLTGILNGADYGEWNPLTDSHLAANYSPSSLGGKERCKADLCKTFGLAYAPGVPVIGFVGRLAQSKGAEHIYRGLNNILAKNARFALLGVGDERYEFLFKRETKTYANLFSARIAFDNRLAHIVQAGADIVLMPSQYEPCGLTQIYAMRYGALPVARNVGGLSDTIIDYRKRPKTATGFLFDTDDDAEFVSVVGDALRVYADANEWARVRTNAMNANFSWSVSAKEYETVYKDAQNAARSRLEEFRKR